MSVTLSASLPTLFAPSPGAALASGERAADTSGDARVRDARTALDALTRPASDAAEERKAAARKKVEQLKALIRMLRMGGGDPEATAKAVAQLARELGAAAKAYAGAGGGEASVATPAAAPEGAAAPEATPAPTDPVEEAAAGKTASGEPSTPADPYRQVIERMQAEAADRARRSAGRDADARFAAEVKGLGAELEAMLRAAQRKARLDGERLNPNDDRAADEALTQVADAVADIAPPLGGLTLSISI